MFIDLNVTKVVTYMIMYVQHEVGHTVLIVGFVQLESWTYCTYNCTSYMIFLNLIRNDFL